jgi:hypothetical protein
MSTRDDSRLTAQERAVLADLEALATADDPQLAARLRGPSGWKFVPRIPSFPGWIRSLWLAVPAVVVGLVLTAVSLSTSLLIGIVGVAMTAGGLGSVVTAAGRRWGGG